jgi:hypothetical protein
VEDGKRRGNQPTTFSTEAEMKNLLFKAMTLSASTVLLFGCGGSDDPTPVAVPPPPPASTAVAAADAYTLDWNAAKRLSVQDNDTSSNGTPVVSVTETPKNGTVKVDGAALVYTPNTGFATNLPTAAPSAPPPWR